MLAKLDRSDFDELWLFAVDVGDALTAEDCAAIAQFRCSGRGQLVTRDHMDLGSSVCTRAESAMRIISIPSILTRMLPGV